jgi:hypothetical protein
MLGFCMVMQAPELHTTDNDNWKLKLLERLCHKGHDSGGERRKTIGVGTRGFPRQLYTLVRYCDVFCRTPSLLGNRKSDTSMDTLATPVLLRCMATNSRKASVSIGPAGVI